MRSALLPPLHLHFVFAVARHQQRRFLLRLEAGEDVERAFAMGRPGGEEEDAERQVGFPQDVILVFHRNALHFPIAVAKNRDKDEFDRFQKKMQRPEERDAASRFYFVIARLFRSAAQNPQERSANGQQPKHARLGDDLGAIDNKEFIIARVATFCELQPDNT